MLLRQMATNAIVRHARWALQCQPARGQHAASALEQFHGEELYDPAYSEPPKGTQSHRTDTFVKEVQILLKHQDIVFYSLRWRLFIHAAGLLVVCFACPQC